MCAPARTSAGRSTGRSVGLTIARSSRPCRLIAATATPRKKLAVSVERPRRAVAPMPMRVTPKRTTQVSSRWSSLRTRSAAPAPRTRPTPTVIAGHATSGIGSVALAGGLSAKSAATARSGKRSSAWAISLKRSASGPRAFSRSTTQRTAWRVVSEHAAPTPPATRMQPVTRRRRRDPQEPHRRPPLSAAATTPPRPGGTQSVPSTSKLPNRTRLSPAWPKSRPTANASQPTATSPTGWQDSSMSPPDEVEGRWGPRMNPSATYSTPEGRPAPDATSAPRRGSCRGTTAPAIP